MEGKNLEAEKILPIILKVFSQRINCLDKTLKILQNHYLK